MMEWLLADRQGITRAGVTYLLHEMGEDVCKYVEDKAELMCQLGHSADSVVVLDYTLFDFNDANEMLILSQRFPKVQWLLFSEELSAEFLRLVITEGAQFSVVMKDSPLTEIREALRYVAHHRRFICQHATELLLTKEPEPAESAKLTKTEQEILKDIALGMTTKEIAAKRFSSFHTVNTHRKNIFRKLGVNNVHEATKYALRAGLIDAAEYYI